MGLTNKGANDKERRKRAQITGVACQNRFRVREPVQKKIRENRGGKVRSEMGERKGKSF